MIWGKKGNGCIRRITDDDIQTLVFEITAVHFCATCIYIPNNPRKALGIRLPNLTLLVKYLKLPFCIEFEVLDSKNTKRRFRASNCQSTTKVTPLLCHMPMALDDGWNRLQIDLPRFVQNAYKTDFVECLGIQIYANCRLRAVYFSDRWYEEEETPSILRMLNPSAKTISRLEKIQKIARSHERK
ncbi:cilia- and flagella-associated protein 20-like [Stegodyphus dumicola]|uniref:cilia- and flagella-associated protein 20-like n=1 Tax=Stegodyphus dumicola TaxID=202533 RepID=UPI0015AE0305|nr:cilia- and flagella-associated protein 20-like [Stegodyphus dumicola]